MAKVKKQDIPMEFDFMEDFWKFIKSFYIPEESEAYWDSLVATAEDIYAKYPTDMAKKLLCAYMDYLDTKWHKERGSNG